MKLIIEDDEGRRTMVPLRWDELSIGRALENSVRLTEKNVSRQHAKLVRKDGCFFIEDASSFTGIRVNGEKVHGRRRVGDGDLIQIGEFDLILMAGPDDKPPPPDEEEARQTVGAPAAAALRRSRRIATASLVVLGAVAALWLSRGRGGAAGEVKADRAIVDSALRAATQAIASHRYGEAVQYLEVARNAGAASQELRGLNQMHDEAEAESRYRDLESAIAAQDAPRAQALLDQLAATRTWYGALAARKADEVRALSDPSAPAASH
jgi:pSer/pThr/pTyr-binding forkhead associated (FHA) protein